MIPIILFAFMIFSFRCLSKYNFGASVSPKCFCSFTFGTTVPLKKSENNYSVARLLGSGLNSMVTDIGFENKWVYGNIHCFWE